MTEYLPLGRVEMDGTKIDSFDEGTYDLEFAQYSASVLENMFKQYTPTQMIEKGFISETVDSEDINKIQLSIRDLINSRVVSIYD